MLAEWMNEEWRESRPQGRRAAPWDSSRSPGGVAVAASCDGESVDAESFLCHVLPQFGRVLTSGPLLPRPLLLPTPTGRGQRLSQKASQSRWLWWDVFVPGLSCKMKTGSLGPVSPSWLGGFTDAPGEQAAEYRRGHWKRQWLRNSNPHPWADFVRRKITSLLLNAAGPGDSFGFPWKTG